jgi:8-oxo-dGTP diphosphatase
LPNASAPSSTPPSEPIVVVAAVIESDDRVLVTRRLRGTHLEGMWEFPGGKVDTGEAHKDALRREIREELDASVDVHELLLTTTHHYPERSVSLHFFRCTLLSDARPLLGQEMRWIRRADLDTLAFPPADRELIDLLSGRAPHASGI